MLKGIVFDLDGVLVSTDEFHYKAWKKIADENGLRFSREMNNKLRGVSRMASLEIILKENNIELPTEEKERLCEEKNGIYRSSLSSLSKDDVDEDVFKMLKDLKEHGLKLALGSSSKNARLILDKTGLAPYFDKIVDGTMISHSKPHPEVFLTGAELLGLSVDECAIVEDAEAGIDAGKAGGFLTFGIKEAAKYQRTDVPVKGIKDLEKQILIRI